MKWETLSFTFSLSLSLRGKSSFAMRLLLSKAKRKRLLESNIFLFTHVTLLGRGPSTNKSNFSSETKKHDKYSLVLINYREAHAIVFEYFPDFNEGSHLNPRGERGYLFRVKVRETDGRELVVSIRSTF